MPSHYKIWRDKTPEWHQASWKNYWDPSPITDLFLQKPNDGRSYPSINPTQKFLSNDSIDVFDDFVNASSGAHAVIPTFDLNTCFNPGPTVFYKGAAPHIEKNLNDITPVTLSFSYDGNESITDQTAHILIWINDDWQLVCNVIIVNGQPNYYYIPDLLINLEDYEQNVLCEADELQYLIYFELVAGGGGGGASGGAILEKNRASSGGGAGAGAVGILDFTGDANRKALYHIAIGTPGKGRGVDGTGSVNGSQAFLIKRYRDRSDVYYDNGTYYFDSPALVLTGGTAGTSSSGSQISSGGAGGKPYSGTICSYYTLDNDNNMTVYAADTDLLLMTDVYGPLPEGYAGSEGSVGTSPIATTAGGSGGGYSNNAGKAQSLTTTFLETDSVTFSKTASAPNGGGSCGGGGSLLGVGDTIGGSWAGPGGGGSGRKGKNEDGIRGNAGCLKLYV